MDGAPHDFRYVAAYSRRLLQRLAAIENHVMTLIRERKKNTIYCTSIHIGNTCSLITALVKLTVLRSHVQCSVYATAIYTAHVNRRYSGVEW